MVFLNFLSLDYKIVPITGTYMNYTILHNLLISNSPKMCGPCSIGLEYLSFNMEYFFIFY